jgi:Domain of unknown function (DUF4249)
MKKIALFLLIVSFMFSCVTEITDFTAVNQSTAIVVYGELTNQNGPYTVRLNATNQYSPYDPTEFIGKPVQNADVKIVDGAGKITQLSEIRAGVYQTNVLFKGVLKQKYKLLIKTADGLDIESDLEELKNATPLSDFSYKFVDAEKVEDMRFELKATLQDAKETEDYYFIKRQDFIRFLTTCPEPPPPPAPVPPCFTKCWKAPLNTKPILLNDFLVNGKNIPIKLDMVTVEDFPEWVVQLDVFSVSKNIFNYWKRQEDQRTVTGGIFDKVPAQIIGNLRCTNKPDQQVLGVFVVSGLAKQRITIDRFKDVTPEAFQKIVRYADFKNIRFKYTPINDCKQFGNIPYNIGYDLPPLLQ